MAAGHIIPWTSPGGTPCCCGSVLPEVCVKPLSSGFFGTVITEALAAEVIDRYQLRMSLSYAMPAFQVESPRPAGFSDVYVTSAVTGGVTTNVEPIPGYCAYSIFSQKFVDGSKITVRPDGSTTSIDYDDVITVVLICEFVQDEEDYIAGIWYSLGYNRISTAATGPTLFSLSGDVALFGQSVAVPKDVNVSIDGEIATLLSDDIPQLSMSVSFVP